MAARTHFGPTMSTLTWTADLCLDQPRMDATHREFVDLLSALEQALARTDADLDAALQALTAHTLEHFAQEERWMEALGFAAENCHALQHQSVLKALRDVQQQHAAGRDREPPRRLAAELALWFPAHARMMDAALAETMAEHGFDPDSGAPPPAEAAAITGCGGTGCR